MADEKVIIEFDIELAGGQKDVDKLTDSISENTTAIKANRAQQKKLAKSEEDQTQTLKKLQQEEFKLKDRLSDLNRERKKAVDITKIQANSLEGLRKQTKALFNEREKLNTNTKEGAKRFTELTNKIKSNNDQVKKADQAAGSYTSSIGSYKDAMVGVSPVFSRQVMLLGQIKTFLLATKAALVTNVTALKLFKTALISTGIGALVVAIGTLITFLTKTQRGMDGVSKVMAAVGAVVDVVIDRISSLGESFTTIIDGILNMDFDQIKEGIDGIAKGFEGMGEEIERESKAAFQLEEDFQKLRDNEIAFISKRAELERDINKLRVQAAEVQEEDAAKSLEHLEEAEKITKRLIATEQAFAKEELRIAEERLGLGESLREDREAVEQLRAKVFDQEAARLRKLTSIEKEQLTLRRTVRKEELEEKKELLKEEKEAREELEESIEELDIKRLEIKQEQSDEEIALIEETNELEIDLERVKIAKMRVLGDGLFQHRKQIIGLISQSINASLKNEETRTNKSFDIRQKRLNEALASGLITQEQFDKKSEQLQKSRELALYKIERERFETNKKIALANVAIDIAGAVAKVWAQTGIAGIFAQALPIAAGIVQASIIASQEPPPPPQFGEGGDVKSAVLGGKYHTAGGVDFVGSDGTKFKAEKDEGIFITKRRATAEALSVINQRYGGKSFNAPGRFFASGGSVIGTGDNAENIRQIITQTLKGVKIVTQVEDIQTGLLDFDETINAGVV